jgi:hypothetical protein
MITFTEFMSLCEATGDTYDAEFRSGAQVIKTGEGGRVGSLRRKTTPEIRRTKRVGGGKTEPVVQKPRKDIGKKRESTIEAPKQERGSARETQLAAAKEERRKAAQARIAAKKKGADATTEKPKTKDLTSKATELLRKKSAAKPKSQAKDSRFSSSRDPEDHMIKGKYTKPEKKKLVRAGKRLHRDIVKGVEKPASHYQP